MAQTALNGHMDIPENEWTKVSENNCTFVVVSGSVQVIGTDGTDPDDDDKGIPYARGQGEDASTDMLARFVGAGTADGLFARGSEESILFVSRSAVA